MNATHTKSILVELGMTGSVKVRLPRFRYALASKEHHRTRVCGILFSLQGKKTDYRQRFNIP